MIDVIVVNVINPQLSRNILSLCLAKLRQHVLLTKERQQSNFPTSSQPSNCVVNRVSINNRIGKKGSLGFSYQVHGNPELQQTYQPFFWVITVSRSLTTLLSSNMTWLKGLKMDQLPNLIHNYLPSIPREEMLNILS